MEAVRTTAASVEPCRLGGLEQAVRANHIGGDKGVGAGDRTIDMAFGREVDDRVDRSAVDQLGDEISMANAAQDQFDAVQTVEIRAVARVGHTISSQSQIS